MYRCMDNQIIYKDILKYYLFQIIENYCLQKYQNYFMIHLDIKMRLYIYNWHLLA